MALDGKQDLIIQLDMNLTLEVAIIVVLVARKGDLRYLVFQLL